MSQRRLLPGPKACSVPKVCECFWKPKNIPKSYLHHPKIGKAHICIRSYDKQSSDYKNHIISGELFPRKRIAPKSARRATKTRGRRRVLRTIASKISNLSFHNECFAPLTSETHSNSYLKPNESSECLREDFCPDLETCSVGRRKALQNHICIILK